MVVEGIIWAGILSVNMKLIINFNKLKIICSRSHRNHSKITAGNVFCCDNLVVCGIFHYKITDGSVFGCDFASLKITGVSFEAVYGQGTELLKRYTNDTLNL